MSSSKHMLDTVLVNPSGALAQSMASSFNSLPTMIKYLDNVSYQINITTSNSTGTFSIQGSNDYQAADGLNSAATGNWVTLTLSGTPVAAGANDNIMLTLNQLPFRAIRLVYVSAVAGTGTCNCYIVAKQLS